MAGAKSRTRCRHQSLRDHEGAMEMIATSNGKAQDRIRPSRPARKNAGRSSAMALAIPVIIHS